MAPDTAVCFAPLAMALWLASGTSKSEVVAGTAILGMLTATIALAALLSCVTSILGPMGWWGFTIMAVHTAVLFIALGVAIFLCAQQPDARPWVLERWPSIAFACGVIILVFIGLTTSRSLVRISQTDDLQLVAYTHGLVLAGTFISLVIFLGVFLRINHVVGERQRLEDTLRESEGFYRALFDNMLNGFAYCQMVFDHGQPQDFIYLVSIKRLKI